MLETIRYHYLNDPKFSEIVVLENSADQDQSGHGQHCLPFRLHLLDTKATMFNFKVITANFRESEFFGFYGMKRTS